MGKKLNPGARRDIIPVNLKKDGSPEMIARTCQRFLSQATENLDARTWVNNRLLLIFLILTIFFVFSAGYTRQITEKEDLRIAVIVQAEYNPYFQEMEKAIRETARQNGIDVVVIGDDEFKVKDQQRIIRKLLDLKIKAVLIIPDTRARFEKICALIAQANRLQIPVISLHGTIDARIMKAHRAHFDCMVSNDKREGAYLAGKYIGKKLRGKGKILVIEGYSDGQNPDNARREGFMKAIHEYPRINTITAPPGNWRREASFAIARDFITRNPDISAVFTYNESMALGVSDAVDYLRVKKPVIVAFDGTGDGISDIRKGRFDALVNQKGYEIGKQGVESTLRLINGETAHTRVDTGIELITWESLNLPFH